MPGMATTSTRRATPGTPAPPPGQGTWHAARLTADNPSWLILWGRYERAFWAFPRFDALPGTLITGPDPAAVLAGMRAAEHAAAPPRADHGSYPAGQATDLPPGLPAIPAPEPPRTLDQGHQHRAQP
jgi:hypothetical protein